MSVHVTLPQAAAAGTELIVGTLRSPAELEQLSQSWKHLELRAAADLMQTFDWSMAAARTLHAGARLRVLTLRRGALLAAVAPLVEVRRNGVRWLEIIGAHALGEPASLLADSADARQMLCRVLLSQSMPILLQRLDCGGLADDLRTLARGRAMVFVLPGSRCLRVDLTGDYETYARGLKAQQFAKLPRKRRQMEELGAVTLDCVAPAPAQVTDELRNAFEVEARSWKGEVGSAVLQQPAMLEFFCELGRRLAADGSLLIRRLRVGAETVAMQVAAVRAERAWGLKIGYDQKWARYSPGLQLTVECVRDGFGRKFRSHEFLGSADSWQEPFATSERRLQTVVVYPVSPTGIWSLAVDGLGAVLRRIARMVSSRKSARQ